MIENLVKKTAQSTDKKLLQSINQVVSKQVKVMHALLKRAEKKPDLDVIHDLRIALRRFLSTIMLFEYLISHKVKKRIKNRLRKLTDILSALRNIDEAIIFFRIHMDVSDKAPFFIKLGQMRDSELQKIRTKLPRLNHKLFKCINEMLGELKEQASLETTKNILANKAQQISRAFADEVENIFTIAVKEGYLRKNHRLRIAIRKWRYYLEARGLIMNRNDSLLINMLKKYQLILGKIHDITEFKALIRKIKIPVFQRKQIKKNFINERKRQLKKLMRLSEQKSLLTKRGNLKRQYI